MTTNYIGPMRCGPMITGENNNRVFALAQDFNRVQNSAKLVVNQLNHGVVSGLQRFGTTAPRASLSSQSALSGEAANMGLLISRSSGCCARLKIYLGQQPVQVGGRDIGVAQGSNSVVALLAGTDPKDVRGNAWLMAPLNRRMLYLTGLRL